MKETKRIGAYEAKTHLPELLEAVRKGQELCITKHGEPIALLVPMPARKGNAATTIRALKALRKGQSLGRLRLRDLIRAGRRT